MDGIPNDPAFASSMDPVSTPQSRNQLKSGNIQISIDGRVNDALTLLFPRSLQHLGKFFNNLKEFLLSDQRLYAYYHSDLMDLGGLTAACQYLSVKPTQLLDLLITRPSAVNE